MDTQRGQVNSTFILYIDKKSSITSPFRTFGKEYMIKYRLHLRVNKIEYWSSSSFTHTIQIVLFFFSLYLFKTQNPIFIMSNNTNSIRLSIYNEREKKINHSFSRFLYFKWNQYIPKAFEKEIYVMYRLIRYQATFNNPIELSYSFGSQGRYMWE